MASITNDCIQIQGISEPYLIHDFKLNITPNNHGHAMLNLEIVEDGKAENMLKSMEDTMVIIKSTAKSNTGILFKGYMAGAVISRQIDRVMIEIQLITATIKFDKKRSSSSFQKKELKYAEILSDITGEDGGNCAYLDDRIKSEAIELPIIRYKESTWEFAKRLGSRYWVPLVPDELADKPVFSLGIKAEGNAPESGFFRGFRGFVHAWDFIKRKMNDETGNWTMEDYSGMELDSFYNYKIGMSVTYKGKSGIICAKRAEMVHSELIFSYVIGSQELYAPEPIYHKHLLGRCLTGTVVKCENETVKLQLDIDEESGKIKSEADLYPFPWKPETGNLLYCMPEKDIVVSLYIGGINEGEAIVINTLRKKDGKDTSKPENRYLTTADNKRLFMKEKEIGFSVEDKDDGKTHFVLQDDKGITFQTKGAITIQAKGKIQINGKTVTAEAKKAVNLTQDSAQIGLRSKKVSITGSSIHLGFGVAMMELLANPKYNINLKGKTKNDVQKEFNNFMRSNVWNQANLSNAEKVELTKKNFSNLSYQQMENFNVIANADALDSKQDYTDWGASGNWPPINWPDNMGLADGYQEVDRNNPVPVKLDRIGSLTGSNFGVMPDDGHIYNQDDRSIPYVDNANAYHQYSFDSTNYFDYIDCISDENNTTPDKLNEMIKRNAVDGDIHEEITQDDYRNMKDSIKRFEKDQEIMESDSKYGLIGNAARWENNGKLVGSGGAGQLNTPVNGLMLEKMGVLKEIKI